MDGYSIHKIMLKQYVRRLHTISGQINLYIHLCCKEDNLNMKRLKSDIKMIKDLVTNIEIEIDSI